MEANDRKPFAESMAQMFAAYAGELTQPMLDTWWSVFAGEFTLRELQFAMTAHIKDPDRGRFKPVPADVLHHLRTTLPAARAKRRAERMREARDKAAPLETELYRLQTDLRNGVIEEADRQRARARINGLAMQIAGITRDAGIDDTMRITSEGGQLSLTQELDKLEAPRADP